MRLDDVLEVLGAFEDEGVRYALFGALALAAHGLDRATRDIDVLVAPDSANVARLRSALLRVFDDPSVAEITSEDLGGDYPAVQYGPPGVDYTIDIVARLGDAFSFEDLEIQVIAVGARTIRVVSPRTLYEMKRDTLRHRDRDDAERLRRAFHLED